MITPLPEILKSINGESNAMSNHYEVCFLCGHAEKVEGPETNQQHYLCPDCQKVKDENPIVFNKMMVIHAYAWEKGLRAAAKF